MNLKRLNEELKKLLEESEDNTKVFDIDFTAPDASEKLEEYKQEGIEAFKRFLESSEPNSFLSYTIRRTNSQYPNDYVIYVDILYDFGIYENQYKMEVRENWSSPHTTTSIFKKVSIKPATIEKNIEIAFDKAVRDVSNLIK